MRKPVFLSVLVLGLLVPLAFGIQPAHALRPASQAASGGATQSSADTGAGSGTRALSGLNMTAADTEDLSVDFGHAFGSIENPYLSDSMKLNYQISLLEKLTERQGELVKISESFGALGIPFNEPAPSRGICEQLPPNAPCLKHYPELFSDIVRERKAFYDDLRAKTMAAAAQSSGNVVVDVNDPASIERARKAQIEKDKKIAAEKARIAAQERAVRYQWSEVTCAAGLCNGVILAPKVSGYRTTVQAGSRLGDGTLVEEISSRGIRVIIDGDRIDLRPAPGGDGSATTAMGGAGGIGADGLPAALNMSGMVLSPDDAPPADPAVGISISNIVAEDGVSTLAADTASSSTSPSAAAAAQAATMNGGAGTSGASVVEPTLGPSGLF